MSSGGGPPSWNTNNSNSNNPPPPALDLRLGDYRRRSYANVAAGSGSGTGSGTGSGSGSGPGSGTGTGSGGAYHLLPPSSMPPIQPLPPPITRQASRGSLGGAMDLDAAGSGAGGAGGVGRAAEVAAAWRRGSAGRASSGAGGTVGAGSTATVNWGGSSSGGAGDIRGGGDSSSRHNSHARLDDELALYKELYLQNPHHQHHHLHHQQSSFFAPSYLRHSRHVQRLRRQWEIRAAELRDLHTHSTSNGAIHHPGTNGSTSSSKTSHAYPPWQHRERPPHAAGGGGSSGIGMTGSGGLGTTGSSSSTSVGPTALADVVERHLPGQSSLSGPHDSSDENGSKSNTTVLHPLPSRWAENDAQAQLDLLHDGTEVRFDGVTKSSDEAASVRSDHPMPRECGLYYFEVTVLSRSQDGLIGIGFSTRKVSLNRLPGWEPESWAYHGDDGYIFSTNPSGKPYGPRYSTQDVIGCGVNFRTGNAFFTKNGVYLGVAFTNIKAEPLYPSVGLKKPNEHLRANFGQHSFCFDIDSMMEAERAIVMEDINDTDPIPIVHPPSLMGRTLAFNLVHQYLEHEGYIETLRAINRDVEEGNAPFPHSSHAAANGNSTMSNTVNGKDASTSNTAAGADSIAEQRLREDVEVGNRQKIRKAILEGDIDRALKFISSFYPRVLEDERNKDVYFRLRCRKFIEMMRRYSELQAAATAAAATAQSVSGAGAGGKKAVASSAVRNGKMAASAAYGGSTRIDPVRTQNVGVEYDHHLEQDFEDDDDDDEEDNEKDEDHDNNQDTQMELDDQLNRETGPSRTMTESTAATTITTTTSSEPPQHPKILFSAPLSSDFNIINNLSSDDVEMSPPPSQQPTSLEKEISSTTTTTATSPLPPSLANNLGAIQQKQNELLTAALAYGQQLMSSFGNDPRHHIRKQLDDVFAILAYANPADSVVGGLLDPRGRVGIAEEVHGAILVSLGKPPSAALENVCTQTQMLLDSAAAKHGGSAAAFVNVERDFLRP